jgi:hypothetical protein
VAIWVYCDERVNGVLRRRRFRHEKEEICRRKRILDFAQQARSNRAMNSQTTGLRIASLLFAVFALGHLVRLLKHAQVIVGSHTIPLWISAPLAAIAALLSFWMWKLS